MKPAQCTSHSRYKRIHILCRKLTQRKLLAAGIVTVAVSTAGLASLSLISENSPVFFVAAAILLRAVHGIGAAAVDVSSHGIVTQ